MKNTLQGAYAQDGPDVFFDDDTVLQPGDQNVFIVYPRSLGVLTGPTDPTYDDSEAEATRKILAAIEQARANEETEIYVVGYSQGAGAAAQPLGQLGTPSDIEQFVLIGACGYPYSGPSLCGWCRSVHVMTYDEMVRAAARAG